MAATDPNSPLIAAREGAAGEILSLTLNRPRVLNAIDWDLLTALDAALRDAEDDPTLCCILIEGAGERAFSVGADLRTIADLSPDQAATWTRLGHEILNRLVRLAKPSVAAIRGYALGGGLEIAIACDLRVAATSARLGLPEVQRGWLPGWGGAQRLRALVGPSRAREIVLLGDPIDADTARTAGLVHRVVGDDALADTARQVARRLAAIDPANARAAKALLTTPDLIVDDPTIEADARQFVDTLAQPATRAALTAFLNRKKAPAT